MFEQSYIEKSFDMDNLQSLSLETIESQIKNNPSFVNYHDENTGISILLLAVEEEQYKIVEYLLVHGADPNYKNNYGQTPLHIAVEKCNNKIINLLLDQHADPNSQNIAGDTPMHLAALNGNYKVIRLLLLYNGNPFIKNHSGHYSVDYAKETNHLKSYKILQKYHLENLNYPMAHSMSPSVAKVIQYKGTSGKSSFFLDKPGHLQQYKALKCRQHKSCNSLSLHNKFYDLHLQKNDNISPKNQEIKCQGQKNSIDIQNQNTDLDTMNHKYEEKEHGSFLEHQYINNYYKNNNQQSNELEAETDEYTPSPKQICFDYHNQITPKMNQKKIEYIHENSYPNLFTKALEETIYRRKDKDVFIDGEIGWIVKSINNDINPTELLRGKNKTNCININNTHNNKQVNTSYELINKEYINSYDDQQSNIYYLLKSIHMEQYTNCFIKEGFENILFLVSTMQINDIFLHNIGINIPGHRARIAIKLQEISFGFDFELPSETVYYYANNQFIDVQSDEHIVLLSNWLKTIKMNQYTEHLFNAGYHSVELLLIQMSSQNPLTEDILRNDVHIDKIGYCTRLINKLLEDSIVLRCQLLQQNSERIPNNQNCLCNCNIF